MYVYDVCGHIIIIILICLTVHVTKCTLLKTYSNKIFDIYSF